MSIKEEYKDLIGEKQKIEETKDKLITYFKRQLTDFDIKGHYKVYAFVVKDIRKFT